MTSCAFAIRQRVRLVVDVLPIPVGSEGIVIGYYNREPRTCVVSFDGGRIYEVPVEHLEPAGP